MLYVGSDKSIKLTRGDTAMFTINIDNESTEGPYIIGENDILKFTVRKSENDEIFSFQKVVQGSASIVIEPEDTSSLDFGKYKYDVELTTTTGDVYTVIGADDRNKLPTFEILKEVTY